MDVLIKPSFFQNHTVFSEVYISGFRHACFLECFVYLKNKCGNLVFVSIVDFDVKEFKISKIQTS